MVTFPCLMPQLLMLGMYSFRSIKHYFLLDQGDFIVQFMDTADDELKKTMEGKLKRNISENSVHHQYELQRQCK